MGRLPASTLQNKAALYQRIANGSEDALECLEQVLTLYGEEAWKIKLKSSVYTVVDAITGCRDAAVRHQLLDRLEAAYPAGHELWKDTLELPEKRRAVEVADAWQYAVIGMNVSFMEKILGAFPHRPQSADVGRPRPQRRGFAVFSERHGCRVRHLPVLEKLRHRRQPLPACLFVAGAPWLGLEPSCRSLGQSAQGIPGADPDLAPSSQAGTPGGRPG